MYCDTSAGDISKFSIYSNPVAFYGDMNRSYWGRDGGGGYNVCTAMQLIYRIGEGGYRGTCQDCFPVVR